jgi:hypothetical protein
MKAVHKPKSLPWLARRAGMPDHVADTLWNKALTLAGNGNAQVADARRQAEAMRYLLLMLGFGAAEPGCNAGKHPLAHAVMCQ